MSTLRTDFLTVSLWYMHMIDEFTRFSAGAIIKSKTAAPKVFMKYWLSIFGAPKKIFSDNGGEFIGDSFTNMCEKFNIKIQTTPSKSPWSNGLCERHNQTLTTTLLKVKDDTGCDYETALSWALCAKNSLINNNGFSPSQLVFGRNTNLPNLINNKLPAQEKSALPDIALHISALHSARKAFIATESINKIKLALKKNIRGSGIIYNIGDDVFYKSDDSQTWKGPATVLGQDGPVVFIRQGSHYIKAHTCRVQPSNPDQYIETHQNIETQTENRDNSTITDHCHTKPISRATENESDDEITPSLHDDDENNSEITPSMPNDVNNPEHVRNKEQSLKLKPNDVIRFSNENDEICIAKVIRRAGKVTGKYKDCYNIEYEAPEILAGTLTWIDISKFHDISVNQPVIQDKPQESNKESNLLHTEEIFETQSSSYTAAKERELQSWIDNKVYETVPYRNQRCISVRWVCTMKTTSTGLQPKARLVARGFEEDCLGKSEKESPTCYKDTFRAVLSLAIQNKWDLQTIDIKTAFLQGESINRDVYILPPSEAKCKEGFIWKLNKSVYGLSDASLQWYSRVKSFVKSTKGVASKVDPSLFLWYNKNDALIGYILVHVDDFLFAGIQQFHRTVISKLRETFQVGKEEKVDFKYIGLNINATKSHLSVDQHHYINNVKKISIALDRKSDNTSPLTSCEKDELRAKIGQLLWVSNQTRPDISFDVSNLASRLENATIEDIKYCNKIISKITSNSYELKYQKLDGNLKLVLYTDASFGNLKNGGSQGSYIIFLIGENGCCNLLSWQSKKLKRVARSSLTSETLAMLDGVEAALFTRDLCKELFGFYLPIEVNTDNKSLIDAIKSSKCVNEKRLRIDIAALKECISENQIQTIKWINSKEQLADVLTKQGANPYLLLNVINNGYLY